MKRSYLPLPSKRDWSLLIGNALDHFDSALYGFLAPVLAPLFFPHYDPVVQLILAYSVLGTSLITRPLGAFLFGMWAHHTDPARVLSFSLMGVAIMTTAMGFLPTYNHIGWGSPFLLICVRLVRGVCAAGDTTISKLYILEGKSRDRSLSLSHLYQSFSVLGSLVASLGATLVTLSSNPSTYWRIPFWTGSLTALISVYWRWGVGLPKRPNVSFPFFKKEASHLLWKERMGVMKIALVTNIGWITYIIPFVFLNTFIPLITSISLDEMMALNTVFLVLDMVLIPFTGGITKRFSVKYIMGISGALLTVSIVPLFYFFDRASLWYITAVRFWIVSLGLIYLCPLHVFYLDQFHGSQKYLLIGMGNALSAATIGKLTPAVCLFLWHQTGWILAPALFISIICGMGVIALRYSLSDPKVVILTKGNTAVRV